VAVAPVIDVVEAAIVSGLVVPLMTERRSRGEWRRQARLSSAAKTIRALQSLNREITTLAISEESSIDGTSRAWETFHGATVDWNAARHEAALLAPPRRWHSSSGLTGN
jgi:hypothetical protein